MSLKKKKERKKRKEKKRKEKERKERKKKIFLWETLSTVRH